MKRPSPSRLQTQPTESEVVAWPLAVVKLLFMLAVLLQLAACKPHH